MTVYEMETEKKTPKYLRTVGIADGGDVYVSAELFPDGARDGILCAMCDGIPVAKIRNRAYLPTWWIKKECQILLDCKPITEKRIAHIKHILEVLTGWEEKIKKHHSLNERQ